MSDDLVIQMRKVLDEYSKELQERVDAATDKVSRDTVKRLKDTSPRHNGEYYKSWTRKKIAGGYVVHNKKHYRLTHLLENGHAVSNQFGSTQKRAAAHPHIRPAEQEGIREFEELLK